MWNHVAGGAISAISPFYKLLDDQHGADGHLVACRKD